MLHIEAGCEYMSICRDEQYIQKYIKKIINNCMNNNSQYMMAPVDTKNYPRHICQS